MKGIRPKVSALFVKEKKFPSLFLSLFPPRLLFLSLYFLALSLFLSLFRSVSFSFFLFVSLFLALSVSLYFAFSLSLFSLALFLALSLALSLIPGTLYLVPLKWNVLPQEL